MLLRIDAFASAFYKKNGAEVRAEGETAPLWGRRNFVKALAKCMWDAVVLLTRAASHGSVHFSFEKNVEEIYEVSQETI